MYNQKIWNLFNISQKLQKKRGKKQKYRQKLFIMSADVKIIDTYF